jgi:hypothetical protein
MITIEVENGNLSISLRCTKMHVGQLLLDIMAWYVLKLEVEINSLGDQTFGGRYCKTYITPRPKWF